jgi:amino acid permease
LYRLLPRGRATQEIAVEYIVKSLRPIALLVMGAVVMTLGLAFTLASDATLAASSFGASDDLGQAGRWLEFLAVVFVLGAVCTAGWEVILRSAWVAGAEIAAAA